MTIETSISVLTLIVAIGNLALVISLNSIANTIRKPK